MFNPQLPARERTPFGAFQLRSTHLITGTTALSPLNPLRHLDPHVVRAAAVTVCDRSSDAAAARLLLDMLGLLDENLAPTAVPQPDPVALHAAMSCPDVAPASSATVTPIETCIGTSARASRDTCPSAGGGYTGHHVPIDTVPYGPGSDIVTRVEHAHGWQSPIPAAASNTQKGKPVPTVATVPPPADPVAQSAGRPRRPRRPPPRRVRRRGRLHPPHWPCTPG